GRGRLRSAADRRGAGPARGTVGKARQRDEGPGERAGAGAAARRLRAARVGRRARVCPRECAEGAGFAATAAARRHLGLRAHRAGAARESISGLAAAARGGGATEVGVFAGGLTAARRTARAQPVQRSTRPGHLGDAMSRTTSRAPRSYSYATSSSFSASSVPNISRTL